MSTTYVAEDTFLITEKGEQKHLAILIEQPNLIPGEGWSCAVHLEGLSTGDNYRIYGDSSLQALALGMRFCADLLIGLMKGGKITLAYIDGSECTINGLKCHFGLIDEKG